MPETQELSNLSPVWLLVAIALVILLCAWAIKKIMDASQQRALTPQEKLIGQLGKALSPISETQTGKVRVYGEIWDALPDESAGNKEIMPQSEVRITAIDAINPQIVRVTPLIR